MNHGKNLSIVIAQLLSGLSITSKARCFVVNRIIRRLFENIDYENFFRDQNFREFQNFAYRLLCVKATFPHVSFNRKLPC